jgi:predicted heme/steroid binding protein
MKPLTPILIFSLILLPLILFTSTHPAHTTEPTRTFTLEELANYNGKDGKPAYVGLNGLVYDLSGIYAWDQGRHYCPDALAGTDITAIWKNAPAYHLGQGFLTPFPIVGKLAPAPTQATATPAATPEKKPKTTPKPK